MDAHRRLAQSECLTDLARSLFGDMTHGEDGPLAIGKLLNRLRNVPGALRREHAIFRARLNSGWVGRSGFDRRRHRQRPTESAGARLAKIETSVDEDTGEPHLEGILFSIARDVRKHFYEGVLYGLIGVVRVAEVAVSDPYRAPLMLRDEIGKLLPRSLAITGQDQRFETRCERRVP